MTPHPVAESAVAAIRDDHYAEAIFHAAPFGLLLVDRELRIVRANEIFARLVCRRPDELVGRLPGDAIGCSNAGASGCGRGLFCGDCPLRRMIGEVLAGAAGIFGTELQHDIAVGGSAVRLWLEANVIPLVLTNERYALVSLLDITARKQTEQALHESEEKFRAVFKSANDGILAVDTVTRRFVIANPRICRLTGYSEAELLKLDVSAFHPPADLAYVVAQFEMSVRGENDIAIDIPVLCKDGVVRYCDINSALVEIGGRQCIVGLFRDATERRRMLEIEQAARAELAEKNDQLERGRREMISMLARLNETRSALETAKSALEDRVAERTVELDRAYTELKGAYEKYQATHSRLLHSEKLATVGELAAGLSHEIKNRLAVIASALFYLRGELDLGKDGVRISVRHIENEIERATRLINDLLQFSRPKPPRLEQVAPVQVMAIALPLIDKQVREHNISIVKEYAPGLPDIQGDADQLQQVFMNLLLNAAQAMPDGGVLTLAIDALPAAGGSGCASLRVRVRDTGHGMNAKTCERIFDPFFTTKQDKRGTGLGLAIAYGIITGHGGTIEVASQPGRGTEFTIILPC